MIFLLQIMFLSVIVQSGKVEILCPQHCTCDIFEKFRRATCTNRNLARIESNLAKETQLLDLSNNHISSLYDEVFKNENLLNLRLLNISHNKVSEIALRAFEGMGKLKTLDLSYNGLRYILQFWFFHLTALKELYLQGNFFGKLENGPIINSNTLTKLDLRSCHIIYISDDYFTNLPKLEYLDLSDNNLVHIKNSTIYGLNNLNVLNVNMTSLSCDGDFQALSRHSKQKGIRLINACEKKIDDSGFQKFQRMVVEENNEQNSWIYDDESEISENKTIIACNNTRDDKSMLQEIVDLSPVLSILIPFIYGVSVGILLAYIYSIFGTKNTNQDLHGSTYRNFEDDSHLRNRSRSLSRIYSLRRIPTSEEETQNLAMTEFNGESTPMTVRKIL